MADLRVLATMRAPLRGTTANALAACCAGKPWICRTTSRIFCADIRMFLVMALTSIKIRLLRFGFGSVRAVFLECARRRELAQTMANHVFGHEYRVEHLAIMNVESEPHEIRGDHRAARPGLDRRL